MKAPRENHEWKEAVRLELFGDRLQSPPDLVSENSRQIAAIGEKADRAIELLAALTERMDRVERRLQRVESRLERVEGRLGRMERRDLEREILAQPRAFVRRKDMTAVRAVSSDERYDISACLPEEEENEPDLLDVILEGTTPDGERPYVAV